MHTIGLQKTTPTPNFRRDNRSCASALGKLRHWPRAGADAQDGLQRRGTGGNPHRRPGAPPATRAKGTKCRAALGEARPHCVSASRTRRPDWKTGLVVVWSPRRCWCLEIARQNTAPKTPSHSHSREPLARGGHPQRPHPTTIATYLFLEGGHLRDPKHNEAGHFLRRLSPLVCPGPLSWSEGANDSGGAGGGHLRKPCAPGLPLRGRGCEKGQGGWARGGGQRRQRKGCRHEGRKHRGRTQGAHRGRTQGSHRAGTSDMKQRKCSSPPPPCPGVAASCTGPSSTSQSGLK